MNFANVTDWRIPEGDVIRVTDSQNRIIWEKPSMYKDWFYIENTTNSTITPTLRRGGSGNNNNIPIISIETSTDKITWTSRGTTSTSTPITFTIPANSKLYIRCNTTAWGGEYYNSTLGSYEISGNYFRGCPKVGGNILSLMYGSSFTGTETNLKENWYSFACLFEYDTTLTDASELILPDDDVNYYGYYCMFNGCSSLTAAPALPTTNFNKMHWHEGRGTLAYYCYAGMFNGCTLLTTAPALPATTLISNCYYAMFQNCNSLTTTPVLPATVLEPGCYNNMFRNCTSLNNVKCLATDISATNATSNWLENVSSTGTFTKAAGVTWPTGSDGIPSGWTVVEQ